MKYYGHGGDPTSFGEALLDFSVNLNPFGMPPEVVAALRTNIAAFSDYPDPHCRALRAALAEYVGCPAEEIVCGNGAADLIWRLCLALRPKKVLVTAPTFSEYRAAAEACGAKMAVHPLQESEDFRLTERILPQLTTDLDCLFLCNPNNPTGQPIEARLLQRIAARCTEKNILLVVDECFLPFSGMRSAYHLLPPETPLVVLSAFTKTYALAGLRLGYLCCQNEELRDRIDGFGQSWSVSTPAQLAGIAACGCGDFLRESCGFIMEERARVSEILSEIGVKAYPSTSNFLLCRADFPLQERLLTHHILVRSCGNFAGLDEHFFRIGIKKTEENNRLLEALREVL